VPKNGKSTAELRRGGFGCAGKLVFVKIACNGMKIGRKISNMLASSYCKAHRFVVK